MLPQKRRALLELAAGLKAARKTETATDKRTRINGQDPVWKSRAAKAEEHYPATRRGFCAYLKRWLPEAEGYDLVKTWALTQGYPPPSTWHWTKRLELLDALAAGDERVQTLRCPEGSEYPSLEQWLAADVAQRGAA